MDSEYINIKIWVCTNKVRSESTAVVPILREDWNNMHDQERDEFMLQSMLDLVEWDYEEVE